MTHVKQTVAITGASGMVGAALAAGLRESGHHPVSITRQPSESNQGSIIWDPLRGVTDPSRLETVDTVVHLAGENIAAGRWTAALKDRIRRSRVEGTRSLVKSIAAVRRPSRHSSAHQQSAFTANVVTRFWTKMQLLEKDFWQTSVANGNKRLRQRRNWDCELLSCESGWFLARKAALAKMLLPFKLNAGGIIGSGNNTGAGSACTIWCESSRSALSVIQFRDRSMRSVRIR